MRAMIAGLIAFAGVWLALAPAAWAQDTVQVSASVSGGQIAVQVSGSSDPCSYCSSEAVQVEADPSDGSGTSCWPSTPQASFPISTTGGAFSFSAQISVDGGQPYQVCGFVVASDYRLAPFPSAESQPVLVSVPPAPCAPGGEHALLLAGPGRVPINLPGLVDVQTDPNSLQTVSSATLTMAPLSGGQPFYAHTLTGGELGRLSSQGDFAFYIEFARGDGPARITLSYVQSASDDSVQECVDRITRVVRPAPAITPQVAIFEGASPAQGLRRKPARIVYSGDGAAFLGGSGSTGAHVRWTSWGTRQARGSGDDWHDNCVPNCAQGRYSGYPIAIRLWRPQIVAGRFLFTRMTVTYTGARPPYPAYQHGSLTYRLRYDATNDAFLWI